MNIKEIISQMSLEEKAFFLSGKDFWQTMDLEKFGIKSMFLADGPNGVRRQEAAADHLGLNKSIKATCFPTCATVANSWDTKLAEEMAICLGIEAANQKVNILLGPGLNIKRNPLCGRNFEYFSEDPYLSGKISAAYVRGIQSCGISACLKHYAVNNQEMRRMTINAVVDERTLREIYLTGFEIAVKEGKPKTVMTSYNRVNGKYTNEHMLLLKNILREEWKFNGIVVTDWGGNNDRVEALRAGNDLEMPTTGGETNKDVISAVLSGEIKESIIDEALERLFKIIFETNKVLETDTNIDTIKHHYTAEKVAANSIVLLKNKDGALPLKKEETVAVIGDFARFPRFQGAGSSGVNPIRVDTTLESIEETDIKFIGFEQGFKRYGKKSRSLIKKAVKLAQKADTILLYIGLDEATESEGLDRKNMQLPQNQIELIKALRQTGKKIIALLSCGCALETQWDEDVEALLHCGLGGQAGAMAALKVITGEVNPSGKLSESFPISYHDCSSASNFPGGNAAVEYREALYVGYRYYDTANVNVKYPFGFGLSYADFKYSDLKIDDGGVTFKVTNIGKYDGAETAQLYIGCKYGEVFRPSKELKGFAKIFIKVGETKEFNIPFDDYTFRYFNVNTNKWETEACDYDIMVGSSCSDIRLSGSHAVKGTGAKNPYNKNELPLYYSGNVAEVPDSQFVKLYGRELPYIDLVFVKKKRIIADYNTCVYDLRYAKGWTGRFFAWGLRFGYKFLKFIGKRKAANVMMMGMFYMPLRGLSRMTGGMISHSQLDGLIIMFNGKFFKGLFKFLKRQKNKKQR